MAPKKLRNQIKVPETFRITSEKIVYNFLQDESTIEYRFPSTLSNVERAYIHEYCRTQGLSTRSHGKEPNRCLTIYKKKDSSLTNDIPLELNDETSKKLNKLLKTYPFSSKELSDLKEKSNIHVALDTNKTMGRLNNWAAMVPLLACNNEFLPFRSELPIWESKQRIIDTINNNQVVLICGDTGSGKTTQVPQFILDDASVNNRECRVVCTQPRRIAAVSVSERVAAERGESLGNSIGYQIRLESKLSQRSVLLYCTNGVLLRSLMTGTRCLTNVTHIIVDEVHERDRFSDFLLICLRECLVHGIKLILMSATMNTQLFTDYFNGPPVIEVPGRQYHVTEYYLEDILNTLDYMSPEMRKQSYERSRLVQQRSFEMQKVEKKVEDVSVMDPQISTIMDECLMDSWMHGLNDAYSQICHMIMCENVNVNYAHSTTGVTALMVASIYGHNEQVHQLIQLGADIMLKSGNSTTALDLARKCGQYDIAEMLESALERSEHNVASLVDMTQEKLSLYQYTVSDEHIDYDLAIELIVNIHTTMKPGSILFFLPGYDDIIALKDYIEEEERLPAHTYKLYTLHSSMQSSQQKQVFYPSKPGIRKIILSTNIAETSITIDDVVYVIDSGKVKEKSFDAASGICTLRSGWVARSCAKQRAGRAGRTRPGICFHLFSKLRNESMQKFPTPEILRLPLQELCLQTKLLAPAGTSIAEFLSLAIEPPSTLVTRNAVQSLKLLGALDENEDLTMLGSHLVELPVEPHLGKMLLYGAMLKCIDPVLTIVCSLAYKDPFILPSQPHHKKASYTVRKGLSCGTYSDHMSLLRAFQNWQSAIASGDRKFCERSFLSSATLEMIVDMRTQLLGQMRASGFIKTRAPGDIRDLNQYADSWPMVKAALAAGLYPHLARVDRYAMQLRTENEPKVVFHSSSILREGIQQNNSLSRLPTDWVVFDEITRAGNYCLIRGCTLITPITVFLMMGPNFLDETCVSPIDLENVNNEFSIITLTKWLKFSIETNKAVSLLNLRNKWNSLIISRMNCPFKTHNSNEETVISMICSLLTEEHNFFALEQPAGVGQRPKPFIEYRNKNSFNRVGRNQFQSPSTSVPEPMNRIRQVPQQRAINKARKITKSSTADISQPQNKLLSAICPPVVEELESNSSSACTSVSSNNTTSCNTFENVFQQLNIEENQQRQYNQNYYPNWNNYSQYNNVSVPNKACLDDFDSNGVNVTDSEGSSVSLPTVPRYNTFRYFIIKVNSLRFLDVSIMKKTWIFPVNIEQKMCQVLQDGYNVILFYTVRGSNGFQGCAELLSSQRFQHGYQSGCPVKWLSRTNLPFTAVRHLNNSYNNNRRIHVCSDGQELDPETGVQLYNLLCSVEPETPQQLDCDNPTGYVRPIKGSQRKSN